MAAVSVEEVLVSFLCGCEVFRCRRSRKQLQKVDSHGWKSLGWKSSVEFLGFAVSLCRWAVVRHGVTLPSVVFSEVCSVLVRMGFR